VVKLKTAKLVLKQNFWQTLHALKRSLAMRLISIILQALTFGLN